MSEIKKYVPFVEACNAVCNDETPCPTNHNLCLEGMPYHDKALTLDEIVERGKSAILEFICSRNELSVPNKKIIAFYAENLARAFAEEFICKK